MTCGYFRLNAEKDGVTDKLAALIEAGASSGNIFFDQSGGQELHKVLGLLGEGDTLLVHHLSDICRDIRELFSLLHMLQDRKAHLRSLSEPWFEIWPAMMRNGNLHIVIEQLYRLARRMEEGKPGASPPVKRPIGRPCGIREEMLLKLERAFSLYDQEPLLSIAEICRTVGLNERTFYRHLDKRLPLELVRRPKGRKSQS